MGKVDCMNDRTLIIIFLGINLILWFVVLEYVRRIQAEELSLLKRTEEWEKKTCEYYHLTYSNIVEMTQVNLKSMDEFLKEISVKIESGENETNAEKSGE